MGTKEKTSPFKKQGLSARTPNQKDYIRAIVENTITFCLGPPGTGKTHCAAGMAVQMLLRDEIDRIVICRPIVDVGKSIGWLPGTMEEKVGPYLIPLFDELSCYVEAKHIRQLMQDRVIEIVPLCMMRGRTFNNCFVILDEAQNATYEELRTLLTRIGQESKMVLAGDPRQSDLPERAQGAVVEIADKLEGVEGIYTAELTRADIIRNSLIVDIEERI